MNKGCLHLFVCDLAQHNVSLHVSDGELYTGTVADYRGTRPVISRHLSEGSHVDLKLDDTLGWLEGKNFFLFMLPQKQRELDFTDSDFASLSTHIFTTLFQILHSSAPRTFPVRRRFISSLVRLERNMTSLKSLQCLALPKFAP